MIDFLKLDISGIKQSSIMAHPKLKFSQIKSNKDNEVLKEIAEYKKMRFIFHNTNSRGNVTNRAYLEIRVHNLYNLIQEGVSHNYNDFSCKELSNVLLYVSREFGINILDLRIEKIEFGVNIPINKSAVELLKTNILFHNLKSPSIQEFNQRGYMQRYEHTDYLLKIYDKAKQYAHLTDKHILRFEIKTNRKRFFNVFGLERVSDLFNRKVFVALRKELLKRFDELVIVDELNNQKIDEKDYTSLLEFSRSSYWNDQSINTKRKYKLKLKFMRLLLRWNLLETKSYLKARLKAKLLELQVKGFHVRHFHTLYI